jgi:hypothetical protein
MKSKTLSLKATAELFSVFESENLNNLSSIVGGTASTDPFDTFTVEYRTHSNASDTDDGDHDSDY